MAVPYELTLGGCKLNVLLGSLTQKSPNSWNCNRHSHADYELHIILRGGCVMDVEDNRYTLERMQAILIPPGLYHLPTPTESEFQRLVIPFSPSESPLKKQLETQITKTSIFSVTQQIATLCTELSREQETGDPFAEDMLRALLTKLMICCFRILGFEDCRQTAKNGADTSVSHRIDDYFEVHMASGITAEDLASELHLSRRQLARILKQTYGMGFREKLIRARMDRASWLLRSTGKSIPEIAFEVGYSSDAAFFAVFKAHFGRTPANYREKYRSSIE